MEEKPDSIFPGSSWMGTREVLATDLRLPPLSIQLRVKELNDVPTIGQDPIQFIFYVLRGRSTHVQSFPDFPGPVLVSAVLLCPHEHSVALISVFLTHGGDEKRLIRPSALDKKLVIL